MTAIPNLSDLRSRVGSSPEIVYLEGRDTFRDGGEGFFTWGENSTAADNDGTIVKPTTASTGRWFRVFDGAISVRWFGAKTDGSNAALAIQNAINILQDGDALEFPSGTFSVGSIGWVGLTVTGLSNVRFVGKGILRALAQPSQVVQTNANVMLKFASLTGCTAIGLRFDGNGVSTGALGLTACTRCEMDDIHAEDCGDQAQFASDSGNHNVWRNCSAIDSNQVNATRGFWLGNSNVGLDEQNLTVVRCTAINNNATGIVLQARTAVCMECIADDNNGSGIISPSSDNAIGYGHIIVGNICRRNAFHGYQTDDFGTTEATYLRDTVVSNNRLEGNTSSGMLLNRMLSSTIADNVCIGNTVDGITVSNAKGLTINDNICRDNRHGINLNLNTSIIEDLTVNGNILEGNAQDGFNGNTVGANSELRRLIFTSNIARGNLNGVRIIRATGSVMDGVTCRDNIASGNTTLDFRVTDGDAAQISQLRLIANLAAGSTNIGAGVALVNEHNSWN